MPDSKESKDSLSSDDRRFALLFGAPSFALALCLGVLSTYLPLLARRFTSSTAVIGLLIGGEGLIAVLLPIWVGRYSDRIETRLGRRLPFLLVTAPIAAAALGALPFAPSLAVMAVEVLIFYIAYFTYFSPYRALYPDFISEKASGRAQGIQGVFTGAGLGVALVGGGFLVDLWRPLPYLLGGVVLLVATAIVTFGIGRRKARRGVTNVETSSPLSELMALLRKRREILFFAIGNALLTLGLSGLKSFVVLWLTEGLGKSMTFTAVAMIVVAVGTVVGALASGKLGDRYGAGRVLCLFLFVFGGGLAVGTFSTSVFILGAAFPIIAICGGAAVALPYALLMRLAPEKKHGIIAGLFDASSGVGTLLGPALTGTSIDLLGRFFPSSHGFSAMWPVLSIAVLGSAGMMRYAHAPSEGAACEVGHIRSRRPPDR